MLHLKCTVQKHYEFKDMLNTKFPLRIRFWRVSQRILWKAFLLNPWRVRHSATCWRIYPLSLYGAMSMGWHCDFRTFYILIQWSFGNIIPQDIRVEVSVTGWYILGPDHIKVARVPGFSAWISKWHYGFCLFVFPSHQGLFFFCIINFLGIHYFEFHYMLDILELRDESSFLFAIWRTCWKFSILSLPRIPKYLALRGGI